MNKIDNPCPRCGKQRIVVKVKKERINGSLVTTTITACPDPECQKLIERQLKKEKDARDRLINASNKNVNPFNGKRKDIVLGQKKSVSKRFASNYIHQNPKSPGST